jgi:hypothetical protein
MMDKALNSRLDRLQQYMLTASGIAAALSLLGGIFDHGQFFESYLFAWLFWCGLSLGALVIAMMQFLTGGLWGMAIRRLSEAAFMALPVIALLFAPILLGMHDLFPWSRPNAVPMPGWVHKHAYLNTAFFVVRTIFYFAAVITMALLLRRWSILQDAGNPLAPRRLRALSAGGLVLYVLCMNFASTDWVMSLEPQWYSTIFVIVFMAGQFLSALALMTALLAIFSEGGPPAESPPTKVFHDLGKMLLAFVIFWIYVSFSQFLVIWSGNLPKEISWYLHRSAGGWQWVALVLMLFQFFIPFALLLFRAAKCQKSTLAMIAVLIVLASVVNNFWLVAPSFHPTRFSLHWMDLAELLALGGIWSATFIFFLKRRPLLPWPVMESMPHGQPKPATKSAAIF